MNITDIRVRKIWQKDSLRALISITLDNELAIHDIKIIEGPERLFVAMPSRKDDKGVFRDVVHPITKEAREELEQQILETYHCHLAELEVFKAQSSL
ncbi:MAG: septation regulator SpoVG [Oscillospiraceae bacterium]|jgi:stage V sporulation protein G|nr:septation regulator SpoVG [Oscillospiraceae bacterium]